MSTIRCVALLTRKAVAMANQQSTDNTDNAAHSTQHSWLPFWNAQMKRKLRRTAASLGRGTTGIREPCTTYFAAFGKQCNGKPVSVFGGQLANLANCIAYST